MARLPRLALAGQPHLVLQRALAAVPAFRDEEDRRHYLDALREGLATERIALHAYALRADEVRLLLTPPDAAAPGRLMQTIGRRYVSTHNRRHRRSGTLWAGRFRCSVLDPASAVLDAMLWVDSASDEPGASSAPHHLGTVRDPLLEDPPAYWALGNTPFEREMTYRERLAIGLPEARAAQLRRSVLGGWPIGHDGFLASAEALTGRPVAARPRGRPRARRR